MGRLRSAALGAALALAASLGAAAEDDRGFLTRFLEDNLSGVGRVVRIEGFAGALSSRATMRSLSIADEAGVWITLNDVALTWNRGALLSGRIEVEALTAAEIILERLPAAAPSAAGLPAPEATGFSLPELPVSVAIGTLAADRVAIAEAVLGQRAVVDVDGTMTLAGGEGAARLVVARTDGRAGRFAIDAAFANATRTLRLDLALAEGPGGIAATLIGLPGTPALELGVAGAGPLDAFRADLRLATGGEERVTGSLALAAGEDGARHFEAALGGAVAALVAPAYAGFFGPETRLAAAGTAFADGRLEIATLDVTAAAARLAGRLALAPDGVPEGFDLDVRLAARDGAPVLLPLGGAPTRARGAALRVGFDAGQGEAWTLAGELDGLETPDLAIARLALAGGGRIARTRAGVRVEAALDLDASGLAPADPALARALGPALRGRLAADWQAGAPVVLRTLELEGAGLEVGARLTLHTGSDGPLALEGEARIRADDLARFAGLAGRPLAGGGTARLEGRFEPASGATDARVALAGHDLALGVAELDGLLAGPSEVTLDFRRDATGTTVRALALAATTLRLEGAGSIRSAGSSFDARLDFADLAVLGPGWGGAATAALTVRPQGKPGAETIALEATGRDLRTGTAELDRLLAGESRITFAGAREGEALLVERLGVSAGALVATAGGRVGAGDAALTAEIALADLAALGPPWGGALVAGAGLSREGGVATLTLSGRLTGARTGLAEVDRLLAGEARLALEARRGPDGATAIPSLAVAAAGVAATGSGRIAGGVAQLGLDVTLPDLALLGHGIAGALTARLDLEDGGGVQRLALKGGGRGLAVGIAAVDRLIAGPARITLDARREGEAIDLAWATVETGGLVARASGRLAPGASDLAADLTLDDLARAGPGWGGSVTAEARLTGPAAARRLRLGAFGRGLRLGSALADPLLRGETRLLAELGEEGGRIALDRLVLRNPQLEVEASGTAATGGGAATLAARIADLAVILPGLSGPATARGRLARGAGGLDLDLAAEGPGGIAARAAGRLSPDLGRADLTLTGTADLGLANPFLLPRSVAGPVTFDLALRGLLAAASLAGSVAARGARLVDPDYGVSVEGLDLTATLAGGRATVAAAGRIEGGGRVVLEGPVALATPFAADLAVRLERARFTDPSLYDTRVTGTLSLAGPLAGGGRIAGTLRLEETELRIPSTGLGGAAPIPALRHVGEPAAVRATRARAGLDGEGAGAAAAPARPHDLALRIEAPRRIFIRGRGLDAELGGTVDLVGTTAAVVPVGGFSLIRGRLDLLGRRFQLTEGQAQLQGAFAPYLRLAAVTEAEGITVRIEVEGEATEPAIRFLSTPELPEEEVLARLLFGKGIEHISAIQAAQLASAVATLAGKGGEGVVGRLRRGFGLDDLDVSTDAAGNASVRAGRYLTENVYTDVTVGADGRSAVRLNIDVGPALTLRGTASSDGRTGIGLFFERDY